MSQKTYKKNRHTFDNFLEKINNFLKYFVRYNL